jgi:hypothetical protein
MEEYATRLYEVLAPARAISNFFSNSLGAGFLIFNAAVIAAGMWCYLGPVRAGSGVATRVAWAWVVVEFANGVGHVAFAVASRGYFSGLITGIMLIIAVSYLGVSLNSDRRRGARQPSHPVA